MASVDSPLSIEEVLRPGSWSFAVAGHVGQLEGFLWAVRADAVAEVRIVRGDNCRTKDMLFREWASALQFPYYFGHNWDALNECVLDLEWIVSDSIVVAVTNAQELLVDEPSNLGVLMEIIEHASRHRGDEAIAGSGLEGPETARFLLHIPAEKQARDFARKYKMPLRSVCSETP